MAAPHSQDAITATVVRTHACSPRAVLGTSLYSTNISTQLSVPLCVCFLLYHRIEANEKKHSLTLYSHNNPENNNHNLIFTPTPKKEPIHQLWSLSHVTFNTALPLIPMSGFAGAEQHCLVLFVCECACQYSFSYPLYLSV